MFDVYVDPFVYMLERCEHEFRRGEYLAPFAFVYILFRAGVLGLQAWILFWLLSLVFSAFKRFLWPIISVGWWLWSALSKRRKVITVKVEAESFKPEAKMPGSEYLSLAFPDFQFGIYRDGEYSNAMACGYRQGDFLVTPTHALAEGLVIMVRRGGVMHRLPLSSLTWEEVSTDVSIAPCPPTLPLKSAKVAPFVEGLASVTAPESSSGSVGMLSQAGFEMLRYAGSTRPGHSGAPYVQTGKVVGMHLGTTGTTNLGMATDYIRVLLAARSVPVPESSDYYLLQKISDRDRKTLKWRDTGDPEVVEARYGGRYYRMSRQEQRRLERKEEQLEIAEEEHQADLVFGGYGERTEHMRELRKELRSLRGESALESSPSPVSRCKKDDLSAVMEKILFRLETLEKAIQSSADPLPEYSVFESGNGIVPSYSLGKPTAPPMSQPTPLTPTGTSSIYPSPQLRSMDGPKPAPAPSTALSSFTPESVLAQLTKSQRRRMRKLLASSRSSSPATRSGTESPAMISQPQKDARPSRRQ